MTQTRPRLRWWKVLLLVVLGLVAAALAGISFLPWADIRSDEVKERGEETASRERGRSLLEAAAEAHGMAAWRGFSTMEVTAVDRWSGDSPWWPAPAQRFKAERLLGTFTSRLELLDGPDEGEIRGIQSWRPWKVPAGSTERVFLDEGDLAIEFYLPTLQYFDELPFRLLEAETVTWAGEAEIGGKTYERVFATWGDLAAHGEHDQYELWIDPASRRIDKVAYTVRDGAAMASWPMRPLMKAFAVGTLHYQDYREIDGVLVAFKQVVTLGTPEQAKEPLEENYLHQLVVESAAFDTVEPSALLPDPEREEPGDRKPAG